MKKVLIATLLAAQLASTPAFGAEIVEAESQRMGTFGGVRLRVPLGADPQAKGVRAGLTVAPTLHSQRADGTSRTRFGEGLELGVQAGRPALSLAGRPIHRLGAAQDQDAESTEEREDEEENGGPSPLGWAAIGVGVGLVVVVGAFWIWASNLEGE